MQNVMNAFELWAGDDSSINLIINNQHLQNKFNTIV